MIKEKAHYKHKFPNKQINYLYVKYPSYPLLLKEQHLSNI